MSAYTTKLTYYSRNQRAVFAFFLFYYFDPSLPQKKDYIEKNDIPIVVDILILAF